MSGLSRWMHERLPIDGEQLRELTNEPVPNHLKRWWFCLGGTPAYLFVVQIFTGIMLAFYYQSATGSAYESVEYITHKVSFGWYFRGLHKWAATFMVAAVILHQIRVYFTGAYRKPRELNWMMGAGLLTLGILEGFAGYSLPDDLLSGTGLQIARGIMQAIPIERSAGNGKMRSPESPIATATPEKATALPLVPTAFSTAIPTVRPRASSSRKRLTMKSE